MAIWEGMGGKQYRISAMKAEHLANTYRFLDCLNREEEHKLRMCRVELDRNCGDYTVQLEKRERIASLTIEINCKWMHIMQAELSRRGYYKIASIFYKQDEDLEV